jgi:ferrochelatase
MVRLLESEVPEGGPYKSYVGFRYADPLTPEMLNRLREDGVRRAIAFTQYPQYSCSTTGSSLNELYRQSQKLGNSVKGGGEIKWSVIDRWGMHPGFVEAVTGRIRAALAQFPPYRRDKAVLLFSAHSLPMSVVNRGDPYVAEVAMSVGSVMQRLAREGKCGTPC